MHTLSTGVINFDAIHMLQGIFLGENEKRLAKETRLVNDRRKDIAAIFK